MSVIHINHIPWAVCKATSIRVLRGLTESTLHIGLTDLALQNEGGKFISINPMKPIDHTET